MSSRTRLLARAKKRVSKRLRIRSIPKVQFIANYLANVIVALQTLLATGYASLGALELWGYAAIVCYDSNESVAPLAVGSLCLTHRKGIPYALFWIFLSLVIGTALYSIVQFRLKFQETDMLKFDKTADETGAQVANDLDRAYQEAQRNDSFDDEDFRDVDQYNDIEANKEAMAKAMRIKHYIWLSIISAFVELAMVLGSSFVSDSNSSFSCSIGPSEYTCYVTERFSFSVICAIIVSVSTILVGCILISMLNYNNSLLKVYTGYAINRAQHTF